MFLLILLVLPLVNAVVITNTTFFSNLSNYTIHVDNITLDQVTVTNLTIEFYNLSSIGSNFTNINTTYNARADFYGLDAGLTIRNINTSTDLFTSASGSQAYNATLISGHIIRIMNVTTPSTTCSSADRALFNVTVIFFALAILIISFSYLIIKGKISLRNIDAKTLIIIFIGIILGIIFIKVIANSITSHCG